MKRWLQNWRKKRNEPAHLKSGRWGEHLALRLLKKKKYKLVGERIRVGRHDEIDLIFWDKTTLVFVEVKTRKNEHFGRPVSAVNAGKRKRLSRAAVSYLRKMPQHPDYIRFDVVEVIGEPQQKNPEIRHLENVFPLDSSYRLWW